MKKRANSVKQQLPGQVVLVLQGGGALGAYQVGVYQALQESGIEPDWIVGTSIGAVNGAIIAGNPPDRRIAQLSKFWTDIEQHFSVKAPTPFSSRFNNVVSNWVTIVAGIPGFFMPNPMFLFGQHVKIGTEKAAYYTTAPLHRTLSDLIDVGYINERHVRLSLGAVNVRTGEMTYFDSREENIAMEHVMASSAYPPAFPAVHVNEDYYWDGGIYSNTPIEAVLDDNPRRDSLIFTVDVWNPEGTVPETLWQVAGRKKEILYASRTSSHLARQKQIHHLRHVIRELAKVMHKDARASEKVKELTSWGCHTTMYVVRLVANGIDGEDHLKDIDFTPSGIRTRWQAGYEHAQRILEASPWDRPVKPVEGVVIHDALEGGSVPVAAGIDGFAGRTK